ncbi:DMT family transporter [Desulfospira joergensenii]|uniref:DMT family transporter n=1 Tax=Desulfospira joergensenii TaxID=53329 RepID=UPI0003B477CD|nr:DMT family transporter [Desulfospira joergensenii]
MTFKTFILTGLAMTAFALNSILCRFALRDGLIDPGSFTMIRLASGALFLGLVLGRKALKRPIPGNGSASLAMPLMLTLYALFFSLAYVRLDAGTGALILCGAVQVSMILGGILAGNRPTRTQAAGILLAMAGLAWLFLPGLSAPSFTGALAMTGAGTAWGIYSLLGKYASDPAEATGFNFIAGLGPALLLWMVIPGSDPLFLTWSGAGIAVLSGAFTSGGGYVIWYRALKGLGQTQAGVVQLTVPVLAAAGGILFLSEVLTPRLVLAGAAVLMGVGLSFIKNQKRVESYGH